MGTKKPLIKIIIISLLLSSFSKSSAITTSVVSVLNQASLKPIRIKTQKGSTQGRVTRLWVKNQSRFMDNPKKYVLFKTPDTIYKGVRIYKLPVEISPSEILSLGIKVNYKGPTHKKQRWLWHLFDWVNSKWVKVGDNKGTKPKAWNILKFSKYSNLSRFVNPSTRVIKLKLKSNNSILNAKLDYEAVIINPHIWQEDFDSLKYWDLNIDKSVGCVDFPPTDEDVKYSIIWDPSSPSSNKNVLQLEANPLKKGGLFVNAITSRHFRFIDKSKYILSGYFRITDETESEFIDAAIEFVIDYVGHYAEMIYGLNPYTDEYGWIYTRSTDLKPIKLFYIGDNIDWHYFELTVNVNAEDNEFIISKVLVDEFETVVNVPMTSFEKPWKSSTQVYLETHNRYTNCNPAITYYGVSRWDQISIRRFPLQDNSK